VAPLVVTAALLGLAGAVDSATPPQSSDFIGDFETGPPGWQQFDGLNYEEDRPLADSFGVVRTPVRQGSRAARVTVRQGYSRHGFSEGTQLVFEGREKSGDEYWYAWSTLFPREWTSPSDFGIFAEWHAYLDTSAVIGFNASADMAEVFLLSGRTHEESNAQAVNRKVPLLATLSKGRWNEFVMHVRWSVKSDGFVEIYHRIAGERELRKMISLRNVPTFQVTPDGEGLGTYLLLGLYRGSFCPQPTELDCPSTRGEQPPNTIFHDGFVRAPTFRAAAARAFPGPLPELPAPDSRAVQQDGVELPRVHVKVAARPTVHGSRSDVTLDGPRRLVTRVPRGGSSSSATVASFRLRQRSVVVVRQRVGIVGRASHPPFVVTRVRDGRGRTLVELYVGRHRTLRLRSPQGVLRARSIDLDTGIGVNADGEPLAVEMRLLERELHVVAQDRAIVRIPGLALPSRGARVRVDMGIANYESSRRPLHVIHDEVLVGAG
jgi:hypothetical protein